MPERIIKDKIFSLTAVSFAYAPALHKETLRGKEHIIDEIDTVHAAHYVFTAEELDFIINYDIKYRMGKELDNNDE